MHPVERCRRFSFEDEVDDIIADVLVYFEGIWIGFRQRGWSRRHRLFQIEMWNLHNRTVHNLPRTTNSAEGPFGITSLSIVSVRRRVRSASCPFDVVSVRHRVRSTSCPFDIVSVRRCVRSTSCPFDVVSVRRRVRSTSYPFDISILYINMTPPTYIAKQHIVHTHPSVQQIKHYITLL